MGLSNHRSSPPMRARASSAWWRGSLRKVAWGAFPPAGGRRPVSCPVRRLLLAALLLPGSGLFLRRCRVLLLLALLRLAGGGWSARSRRGCGTRSAGRARGERGCALGGHGGSSLGGNRLGLLGARRMDRNDRRVATRELRNRNPRRQRDVREELGIVEAHAREVELEELRQVLRQAAHLDVGAHVRDHPTLALDARRHALAPEVDRKANA